MSVCEQKWSFDGRNSTLPYRHRSTTTIVTKPMRAEILANLTDCLVLEKTEEPIDKAERRSSIRSVEISVVPSTAV